MTTLENINGFVFKRSNNKIMSNKKCTSQNIELNGFTFRISDNRNKVVRNNGDAVSGNKIMNKAKKHKKDVDKNIKIQNGVVACSKENFNGQNIVMNEVAIDATKKLKHDIYNNTNAKMQELCNKNVEQVNENMKKEINTVNKAENNDLGRTINEQQTEIKDMLADSLDDGKVNVDIDVPTKEIESGVLQTTENLENCINLNTEICKIPTYKEIDISDVYNKLNTKKSLKNEPVSTTHKSTSKILQNKSPKKQENTGLSLREPTIFMFNNEQFNLKTPMKINIPLELSTEEKIKLLFKEIISNSYLSIELADLINNYEYVDPYQALINDYKVLISEYENDCFEYENELAKWETAKNDIWNENMLTIPEPHNRIEETKDTIKENLFQFDKEMDQFYEMLEIRKNKMKNELKNKNDRMQKMIKSIFEIIKRESCMDPVLLLKMMSKM